MFVFRLQSVLDCRAAEEEKALLEFSESKRRLELEKRRREELRRQREELTVQFKAVQKGGMSAEEVSLFVRYTAHLHESELTQEGIIAQAKILTEEKREELMAAVKKRKVLERVKAQQLQEYQANAANQEKKQLDEMAVIRFMRRRE